MNDKLKSKVNQIKADVYDSLKEEIGNLSAIKKILFETLFTRIWDILSEDCNESEIAQALNSLEKVNSEYYKAEDYWHYDKCMRYMGFGNNRVGFSNLMRKHGIKTVTFKNVKLGFPKAEIIALASELKEEMKANQKKVWKKSKIC